MTTKSANEIVVCKADELKNGQRKIVTIKNMSIVVLNNDGKLQAFNSMCPHQGAPLEFGSISGLMQSSEPQTYEYTCHNEIVRCPLHGWAFDMETGLSSFSEKIKIRTYKVKEENGVILLETKGKQDDVTVSEVPLPCSNLT